MLLFVLGRQPEISLAEIEAVFQQKPTLTKQNLARLDCDTNTARHLAKRLGSVVKIMEVIYPEFQFSKSSLPRLARQLFNDIDGKITLGISFYDRRASKISSIQLGKDLQTELKRTGHSVRLLPTRDAVLSTAAVLHNNLAGTNPKKIELNCIRLDAYSYCIARTIYVQDIDSYTIRDRKRPRRDARNGMLPPKLAQTMINLAAGACKIDSPATLLDPFCGTGVVLQEASLMGYRVVGTDLNPVMIDNSGVNLDWLANRYRLPIASQLQQADATDFDWHNFSTSQIDLVATEAYLGRPYITTPKLAELKNNITNCNVIIDKFIRNLSSQLPSGAGLCIGVPVWYIRDHIHHLPCIASVEKYGFTNTTTGANLIYHRPEQIVGRELLVLQKR